LPLTDPAIICFTTKGVGLFNAPGVHRCLCELIES
jgi:hypothetical protein